MIKKTRHYQSELAVVGAGIAGCAATVFALNRGIKTIQIGNTGALAYTSGYLDLLGIDHTDVIDDPWKGLDNLRQQEPDHPYSKLSNEEIRTAFAEFVSTLNDMGLNYTTPSNNNLQAMSPAGTFKPTFCIPATMNQSIQARISGARVLFIDFIGLEGFSAQEIIANLSSQWPGLRAQRIAFPDMESGAQVYPEVMARSLEVSETRERLANQIKDIAGEAEYIALPAILGIHSPDHIHREMERLIGLPIFEIPTIPPAVPGIRLRELLEQQLAAKGATIITQQKVAAVTFSEEHIQLSYEDHYGPVNIQAENMLLASGRFLSGGLAADQNHMRETLIGLPIQQPDNRSQWFSDEYFDPEGHAVNRSGVLVNEKLQVINHQNEVIDPRLYAAGIVLANQDWIRQRCGAGVAIATAFKAIQSL
jgi:glycerol-3-phosphate dehydrogenase subunit B